MRRLVMFFIASLPCTLQVASADSVTYNVTVDTTSIAGTSGSLDFNFNPGPLTTQLALLQISDFESDGTLAEACPCATGDVSGELPGLVAFDNATGYNDYFDDFTFATSLSFTLDFNGPALTAPDGVSTSGSTFAFSMFSDGLGTVPTLTNDTAEGFAFTVDVNLDGTTTVTDSSPQTIITPETAAPEPGTVAQWACAVALWIMFRIVALWRHRMTARFHSLGPALLLAAGVVPIASAQVTASITDLGTLGGSYSGATAISSNGQVAGYSSTSGNASTQAFLYSGTLPITPIPTLGGSYNIAYGVNSSGDVVGVSAVTQTNGPNGAQLPHAFLYSTSTKSLTDIASTFPYPYDSYAYGINDAGLVVGWACFGYPCANAVQNAFIYSGGIQKIGAGIPSVGYAISASGTVVGYYEPQAPHIEAPVPATLMADGATPICGLTGGTALAVNASGQSVGSGGSNGAFLCSGGTLTNIPTLGGSSSEALGINDDGWVVGESLTAGNLADHAFLYKSATQTLIDLNSVLPLNSGWVLTSAAAINNAGQIAGTGTINGQTHAFLLTPCPVHVTLSPGAYGPSSIKASLTATNGLSLLAAAQACGFAGFDWVQQITWLPSPSAAYIYDPIALSSPVIIPPQTPINDPPFAPCGGVYPGAPQYPSCGWAYPEMQQPPFYNAYPFYYNYMDVPFGCAVKDKSSGDCIVPISQGSDTLNFYDKPENACLPGGAFAPGGKYATPTQYAPQCQGSTITPPLLSFMGFTTQLVGICNSTPLDTASLLCPALGSNQPSVPLYQWTWISDANGYGGNVFVTTVASSDLPDSTSGSGGVTITSINGVVLPSIVPLGQISIMASGLAYSRVSQTFNGTVTLKNVSSGSISGPLQVVFMGLTSGVTVANATNTLSGTPYISVPSALVSGQTAIVNIQFKNPSNSTISFQPVVYSGNL